MDSLSVGPIFLIVGAVLVVVVIAVAVLGNRN
jgi:hypothetical protein